MGITNYCTMPSYLKLLLGIKMVKKKKSIMLHNLYAVWLFDFLYRQFIVFVTVKITDN